MIVWLASYPRSGNTYFRIILNQIYGIKTYSIHNDPIFEQLEGSTKVIGHHNLDRSIEEMAASPDYFFIKTHFLPSDSYPAIYLVRDGRDALVSYAHYCLLFSNNSKPMSWRRWLRKLLIKNDYTSVLKRLIISSNQSFGSWSQNVQQWVHRDSPTFVIKFEDLIENPIEQVASVLQKINPQLLPDTTHKNLVSFDQLHAQWPSFFRQGKTKSWQEKMPSNLQVLFWQHHGIVMGEMGYERL